MSLISESKKDVVSAESLRAKVVRPVQSYGGLSVATATYEFGLNGGAISSISLKLNKTIPSGAIVVQVLTNATAALTSGGAATGAFGLNAAGDLIAATIVAGVPWTALPKNYSTLNLAATADRSTVLFDIAVATLTAGKCVFRVLYLQ